MEPVAVLGLGRFGTSVALELARRGTAQWLNMRRFIDANPDDEIVLELRAELDAVPAKYVRYRRRYYGWGVFALMKR